LVVSERVARASQVEVCGPDGGAPIAGGFKIQNFRLQKQKIVRETAPMHRLRRPPGFWEGMVMDESEN
jgi:hypothetical protein